LKIYISQGIVATLLGVVWWDIN